MIFEISTKNEICKIMKKAYERGWISTRDGNCSYKEAGSSSILITPSGVNKSKLVENDILRLDIFEGNLVLDGKTPSGELEMHWRLLKAESETACVLHLHPTNIVAAMMAGFALKDIARVFPEVHRYTEVGEDAALVPATSKMLARQTYDAMWSIHSSTAPTRRASIVGQKFHGCCSIGRTPEEAFEHIERLEHVCKITLASGMRPNML